VEKIIAEPNLVNASADLDPGIFSMRIWFRIQAEMQFFTFIADIQFSEDNPPGLLQMLNVVIFYLCGFSLDARIHLYHSSDQNLL
jgi:hypothetical protein